MEEKSKDIQNMFNDIAPKYDFLNRLLSFKTDVKWRKKAIRLVRIDHGMNVLDLACGTADMMIEIMGDLREINLVGGDFSYNMLKIGKEKLPGGMFSVSDAHNLPFRDESFDRMVIAFGFRNVTDKERGLREMFRVMKPGGRICILEFSQPENPVFGALYKFYFTKMLPFIGGLVSGNKKAYEYLPDSVYKFPKRPEYRQMILDAGFSDVEFNPLTMGIADATILIK